MQEISPALNSLGNWPVSDQNCNHSNVRNTYAVLEDLKIAL